ncbi:MAG: biopolymer transporter ExbD [Prevotella sp.]|nr:biopolymer transporter ExbD [Prevotella sp.]
MRLKRRKRRRVPGINTASIADISFTLLILFLVVTSMDDDKGLTRMLPPVAAEQPEPAEVTERNVLMVELDKGDMLLVNGEKTDLSHLQDKVKMFVENPDNLPTLPEKHKVYIEPFGDCQVTDGHVIRLKSHREASYGAYFKVQNEIVLAYKGLRDSLAMARFGRHFTQCNEKERTALRTYYPQKVSEDYSMQEGGKP